MALITLSGSIGSSGIAILGSKTVTITGDTDLVLLVSEYTNQYINVLSDGTSTGPRNVLVPLTTGQTYIIRNSTTDGYNIQLIGYVVGGPPTPSGSGVLISPAAVVSAVCDGNNYLSSAFTGASAGGDLSGTYPNPTVININGTSVPATPLINQVLVATGGTSAVWDKVNNAYVSTTAGIDGIKINPNFGSQNVSTTLKISAGTVSYGGLLGLGPIGGGPGNQFATIEASPGIPGGSPNVDGSLWLRSNGTPTSTIYFYQGGSWHAIGDGTPTGPAGGDLDGYYPNPIVVKLTGLSDTVDVIAANMTWDILTTEPITLSHAPAFTGVDGYTFTIKSQSTGNGGNGGDLRLESGAGSLGGLVGNIVIAPAGGILGKIITISDTVIKTGINDLIWTYDKVPLITQEDTMNLSCNNFTIRAQSSISPSSTGGNLYLLGGLGASTNGTVNINTTVGASNIGNNGSTLSQYGSNVNIFGGSIQLFDTSQTYVLTATPGASYNLAFNTAVTNASITHTIPPTGAGAPMSIRAQAAAVGSGLAGGNLTLDGGLGDGPFNSGIVNIGTLAPSQINIGYNGFNANYSIIYGGGVRFVAGGGAGALEPYVAEIDTWWNAAHHQFQNVDNYNFAADSSGPIINQFISVAGAGKHFTITAQAAQSGSNTNGGNLVLNGGAKDGSGVDGNVVLMSGNNVYINSYQTSSTGATAIGNTTASAQLVGNGISTFGDLHQANTGGTHSIDWQTTSSNTMVFSANMTPGIIQAISTSGTGTNMTITAQAAKTGSNANGGNLVLLGGAKDGAGQNGYINLPQLGGFGTGVVAVDNSGNLSFTAGGSSGSVTIFAVAATPSILPSSGNGDMWVDSSTNQIRTLDPQGVYFTMGGSSTQTSGLASLPV